MVKNVCFPKPKMRSSNVQESTTQRYSVNCHRGLNKLGNIHIWEVESENLEIFFWKNDSMVNQLSK